MRRKFLFCGMVLAAATMVRAQTSGGTMSPRTPWGAPDLQGVWNVAAGTPLERPAELAGKEFFTDEELARATEQARERTTANRRDQTASLTDLRQPAIGPPILPLPNAYVEQLLGAKFQFQIVQNPSYVAIVWETITHVRIIPLDGRPHLPQTVRPWFGDSRGHWEGGTLVVETTNFPAKRIFLGLSAEHLRVVERFTRRDDNTLEYQFTADDPTRWTRPWTATVPVEKTDGRLYEYACHEGNYGLQNILRGARALEKEGR